MWASLLLPKAFQDRVQLAYFFFLKKYKLKQWDQVYKAFSLEDARGQANNSTLRGSHPNLSGQEGDMNYPFNPQSGGLESPLSLAWELQLFRNKQGIMGGQAC